MCPLWPAGGCDDGSTSKGFTRDWGTFCAVLIMSAFYFFVFQAMKVKDTAGTGDEIIKILVCAIAMYGTMFSLELFGILGFNPILAVIIDIFKSSQTSGSASAYSHYLWAYIIAPLPGAGLAAFLHMLHVKTVNKQGGDGG